MDKLMMMVDTKQSDNSNSDRDESVKRCIQSLIHACQCKDANCKRMTCHKMRKVVQHARTCKRRQSSNCPVCKQLIALCCYHAKHCTATNCPVQFILNLEYSAHYSSIVIILGAILYNHTAKTSRAETITESAGRYDDEAADGTSSNWWRCEWWGQQLSAAAIHTIKLLNATALFKL